VREPHPARLFGSGQLDALAERFKEDGVTLFIVDAALTPVQQRNLETELKLKVVDRTGLILEIFGLRARTAEGRLQVEMARSLYERSRLVRTWTHLERQRGGFGFLGGPGESADRD
jgi:GTP-binding protein HflX